MDLIAFEEHCATDEALDITSVQFPSPYSQARWPELAADFKDLFDQRVARMDQAGITTAVLSLSAPGAQDITDPKKSDDFARRTNDTLAEAIRDHPRRFRLFGTLPLQDPDLASAEASRVVNDLGMVGVLVNGFSKLSDGKVTYYDEAAYRPFWQTLAQLDAPMYLHPRLCEDVVSDALFGDHPWLAQSSWGFGIQTGTHVLRLITSGVFDEVPGATVVLGHLGEGLTFQAWRIEHRMRAEWGPDTPKLQRTVRDYLQAHFYTTTSGVRDPHAFRNVLDVLGVERILFATDYPMENMAAMSGFLEGLELSSEQRAAVMSGNAKRLFKL